MPPEWHGWLHYTVDVPPTEETYNAQPWQQAYVPNRTGTPGGLPAAWQHPQSGRREDDASATTNRGSLDLRNERRRK